MENTGYLIMNSSKKLTYELNTALREKNLTAPQWAVIQQLKRFEDHHQSITAIQLTKLLDMDKPTISAIIKRLEQKNLINRRKSHHDNRSYDLYLTKTGKEAYELAKNTSDKVLKNFILPLSAEEQESLNTLLQKLNQE